MKLTKAEREFWGKTLAAVQEPEFTKTPEYQQMAEQVQKAFMDAGLLGIYGKNPAAKRKGKR